ncbi:hypothetical protein BGZ80_006256 [Entomortierella chlamydospora]|uniref:Uncharacterized protein n=1 Tax=Entomortierella chlamydospora TaxID=101097 RepID=A0A9P6MH81_9FUNG|nr:hypothetical protein BGZ79_001396 [Entomortierella chlamydospora]KAG0001013.1 hypothetical protein BGZ80_006256 [Entomortierella chlamydospora]
MATTGSSSAITALLAATVGRSTASTNSPVCLNASRQERTTKDNKGKRVEDDRRAGQLLLETLKSSTTRIHDDTDADVTGNTDLTDSDISSVSTARTPLRKKRWHPNALREQYSSAMGQELFELQRQHLELLQKDWEEQKEQVKIQQEMELERLREQAE